MCKHHFMAKILTQFLTHTQIVFKIVIKYQ